MHSSIRLPINTSTLTSIIHPSIQPFMQTSIVCLSKHLSVCPSSIPSSSLSNQRDVRSFLICSLGSHLHIFKCPTFLSSLHLESPAVTVALSEILIGIGEAAVLACSASGTPQPEIWWYKGKTSLPGWKDQARHSFASININRHQIM